MTPTPLPHLLLLRTPISPLSQDQYAQRFTPSTTHHVPVLSTTFVNLDDLAAIVARGGDGLYSGVVVTSGRSVRAWEKAAAAVKEGRRKSKGNDRETTIGSKIGAEVETGWERIPFFVVGPGTRDGLLRMETPPSQKIYGAEDSGSGIKLAEFVIDYFVKERDGHLGQGMQDKINDGGCATVPPEAKAKQLPLLYLVGDKNRPTLPRLLSLAHIPIQKIQVYSTCASPTLLDNLVTVLDSIEDERVKEGIEEKLVWIVMFSPSGSGSALSTMRELGITSPHASIPSTQNTPPSPYPSLTLKFAAIGPTTLQYLEEDEGIQVSATASSPDAADLEHAIREAEERDEIEGSGSEQGTEEEEETTSDQEKAWWEKSWNWLVRDVGGIGI